MISEVEVKDIPCFNSDAPPFSDLSQAVFVYGPNGSGKSSIARKISAHNDVDELDIVLFDRNYIDRLLDENDTLPGVFTIRDGSPEIQTQIDDLQSTQGGIPHYRSLLQQYDSKIAEKEEEIAGVSKELASALWDKRPDNRTHGLGWAFRGFHNNRENLKDQVLRVRSSASKENVTLEELEAESELLHSDSEEKLSLIQSPPNALDRSQEGLRLLLETPLTSANNTSFAAFVNHLGNRDWIAGGLEFVDRAEGKCPFCQQEAPAKLSESLNSLFDRHYQETKNRIQQANSVAQQTLNEFESWYASLDLTEAADADGIRKSATTLSTMLKLQRQELDRKLREPSQIVTWTDSTEQVNELQALIIRENQAIKNKNEKLENRESEIEKLQKRIWNYYINQEFAEALTQFDTAIKPPTKAMTSLLEKRAVTKANLEIKESELEKLLAGLRSSQDVVDRINKTLQAFGFRNFTIQHRATTDEYQVVREDGSPASLTLSEGERNLISFLYFFHRVCSDSNDLARGRSVVAVLDDPMSSLDSETFFLISHLCTDLLELRKDTGSLLEQVIVLTHNAYFFKEVAYEPNRNPTKGRSYHIIRKRSDGKSEVIFYSKNPIRSSYTLLWDEVKRAQDNSEQSSVSLPNSMRRIVEFYFKNIGGIDKRVIVEKVDPSIRPACKSLLAWLDDGSHTGTWDLDFAPVGADNQTYLRAFQLLFQVAEHEKHYDMMMQANT